MVSRFMTLASCQDYGGGIIMRSRRGKEEMMKKDMTLLVSSCDQYEDCWAPFVVLLRKYWPDFVYDMALCTETKNCDMFPKILHINEPAWSKRLRLACEAIDAPYLLFMLEDFWIESPVDSTAVDRILNMMKADTSVGVVYLDEQMDSDFPALNADCLEIPPGTPYRINAGVAIWRKDFLLSVLDDAESAWDFERIGSFRDESKTMRCLRTKSRIVSRCCPCGAISRGRWVRTIKPFIAKEALAVNLSQRGVEGFWALAKNHLKSMIYDANPRLILKIQNALYHARHKR